MNFLVQFGVGLIVNAVQSAQAEHATKAALQENAQYAAERQSEMQAATAQAQEAMYGDAGDPFAGEDPNGPMGVGMAFADAPPFPEESAQNLQDLQATHATQMQSLSEQFLNTSTAMKNDLFSENHLATTTPPATPDVPQPQPEVVLDDSGHPMLQPGKEQPVHQEARENYEFDQKQTLTDKHTTESQQFMSQEKTNVQQFLSDNRPQLNNPAVQQELHKLLAESQKRALQLTSQHEKELLKHDAYTPEMQANVDNYINDKSSLKEKQTSIEENSEDAAALYQHQQDLSGLLQQRKEELESSTQETSFLTGPPRFNGSHEGPVDVAKVLPPYLSGALYNMGIYEA